MTCAQVYAGNKSCYISVYGLKSDGDFYGSLMDVIRQRGAMDCLISDRAKAEISNRVKEVLRAYSIDDWQSEPYHQNQNKAERMIQEVKRYSNWVLNHTGAPPESWLLVFEYVAFIFNRTARKLLNWRTPRSSKRAHP